MKPHRDRGGASELRTRFHRSTIRPIAIAVAALAGAVLLCPGFVHADGAFPDGQSVLVPPDRPRQIIVAATFGLVVSEDDGATWQYSCESAATREGRLYMMGPAPNHRIYATTQVGAAVSSDDGCTWDLGAGALTAGFVSDVFPDPSDPRRVVAVALPAAIDVPTSVFLSTDGGLTYQGPIFQPPAEANISGVEIAAANNDIIYVTFFEGSDFTPRLARSADSGKTWTILDLESSLGRVWPRLAAIDRDDPDKVYLRIFGRFSDFREFEGLAITTDAGLTWSIPVMIPQGRLTAFLRRQDGTVLVTAVDEAGVARGFRSDDGGTTFNDWALAVHPRGIAERGRTLFVAADNIVDGFALGSSEDGGTTWTPRLRFGDISGVRPCVRDACQNDCELLAGIMLFPPQTCNAAERDGGCGCSVGGPDDHRILPLFGGALFILISFGQFRRRVRPMRAEAR
ncbi:MAG: hypothetical protein H7X95_11635 [Deltaproteobacteria bacterium]|nr:hypothetical protein [Deltaproteobacteria bacterium]